MKMENELIFREKFTRRNSGGRCCRLEEKYHIQAEYKPDNEWIPLQVINGNHNWPIVIEGEIENDGTKEIKLPYMTGKHVMMEYWSRLKGE